MAFKRKTSEQKKIDTGQWLTTYADLMNNLLVLFMLLYAMSIMDIEKFKALMQSFKGAFTGEPPAATIGAVSEPAQIEESYELPSETESEDVVIPVPGESEETSEGIDIPPEESEPEEPPNGDGILDDLDEFLNKITTIIEAKGYQEQIIVERVDEYIYFRFKEGVLFQPDLAVLKKDSYGVLGFVSDILNEAYAEIDRIEISGHTAWVEIDTDSNNFASWELSCKRALTVLKFLVAECGLPKEKMSASGFSSTHPYSNGSTEEEKQLNRRVEIRISRLIDAPPHS
ncbi:MAG: flagellar motor protein MotB [Eubacteriales bacterium]